MLDDIVASITMHNSLLVEGISPLGDGIVLLVEAIVTWLLCRALNLGLFDHCISLPLVLRGHGDKVSWHVNE